MSQQNKPKTLRTTSPQTLPKTSGPNRPPPKRTKNLPKLRSACRNSLLQIISFWPRLRGYVGSRKMGNFHNFPAQHAWVRNRYEVTSNVRDNPVTRQWSDRIMPTHVFCARRMVLARLFLYLEVTLKYPHICLGKETENSEGLNGGLNR